MKKKRIKYCGSCKHYKKTTFSSKKLGNQGNCQNEKVRYKCVGSRSLACIGHKPWWRIF